MGVFTAIHERAENDRFSIATMVAARRANPTPPLNVVVRTRMLVSGVTPAGKVALSRRVTSCPIVRA